MSNVTPIRKTSIRSTAEAMHLAADFADLLVLSDPPTDFLYVECLITAKKLRKQAEEMALRAARVEGKHI